MALDPNGVLVYLRRCGVVTHHVASMPAEGRSVALVVFLERRPCQYKLAELAVRKIPGVVAVQFSGHTRSIMFVTGMAPAERRRREPG
jgi:hypothetical protein